MKDIREVDKNFINKETLNELVYVNPQISNDIKVYGLNWFDQDRLYIRCPKDKIETVKSLAEGLYSLVEQPSGAMIVFYSNTKTLKIKVKMGGNFHMAHMAFTGQGGCDLYIGKSFEDLTFFRTASFNINNLEYEFTYFENWLEEERLFLINLPLYASIDKIEIGIEPKANLKKAELFTKGKVVCYGTSITQGGCASRPGISYTNQLSRRMGYEFLNFGFSGNGRGQKEMAEILASIDNVKLFLLDYEANATLDMLKDTLDDFINIIRSKYPSTPIVVLSKIRMSVETHLKEAWDKQKKSLNYQKKVVKEHQKYDSNIYFLDGHKLLGKYETEATVDGSHPTDLGFMLISDYLEKYLNKWI